MRKIYLLLLISIWSSVEAQYTITSASNPVPGDVQDFIDLDSTGLSMGSSGTSQNWNYSSVTSLPVFPVTSTFVPVSSIPNNFMFPSATIGLDLGGGSYGVLSNTSSKFEYLGYAEPTFTNCWAYSDPLKAYSLPFTYGSTSADTYLLIQSTNTTVGTFTTYGDGTGTLQLPTATIPNVLKLHYTQYESDTTSSGSVYTYSVSLDQFYASVSKFPLLEIQTATLTATTGTNVSTYYYKYGRIYTFYYPLGISNKEKNVGDLTVFPNPVTNGELFIKSESERPVTGIEITNVLGQVILNRPLNEMNDTKRIDLSTLQKGIYFLNIKNAKGMITKKIIIE
jgi:hypothetical protein